MMARKGAFTIGLEKQPTRSSRGFLALGSFFKRKDALESSHRDLCNGAFRLKNDPNARKPRADRVDCSSRPIVNAPVSAIIFTYLLSREPYYTTLEGRGN